jgi:hydroxylamine dehydrogenase
MSLTFKRYLIAVMCVLLLAALLVVAYYDIKRERIEQKLDPIVSKENSGCVECHTTDSPALVMEWEHSLHAKYGVGCIECHTANEGEPDAWKHEGVYVSALVTPKDCGNCHSRELEEFSRSHHARAGEIMASLDNVLAERVCGLPGNNADAVNGCWQCHGSIIKFVKDEKGNVLREGKENKPKIDSDTWPNSGIGRLNPDGSRGSCHACHSRHAFQAKLSRSPENCGKCHMGPDHPQIEIYNESKHGIAFYANRDRMALDKPGEWVLGRDYSAAPTCATCHISSYMTPQGAFTANTHDVGERISWTLRPKVSTKINMVIYEDGYKEDYKEGVQTLPKIGQEVVTKEKVLEGEKLIVKDVPRTVAKIVKWQDRREQMKGACLNCHNDTYVDNFYQQFDGLVNLYNDKFGRPSMQMMADLAADGAINPKSPFGKDVQWDFWELWHHEGRRARHGASMMGPDYTHWHGMYEVAKHYYFKFLPHAVKAAADVSPELKKKYEDRIKNMLDTQPEHLWLKGLTPEEIKSMQQHYQDK